MRLFTLYFIALCASSWYHFCWFANIVTLGGYPSFRTSSEGTFLSRWYGDSAQLHVAWNTLFVILFCYVSVLSSVAHRGYSTTYGPWLDLDISRMCNDWCLFLRHAWTQHPRTQEPIVTCTPSQLGWQSVVHRVWIVTVRKAIRNTFCTSILSAYSCRSRLK